MAVLPGMKMKSVKCGDGRKEGRKERKCCGHQTTEAM
jgi:hypothetical protein